MQSLLKQRLNDLIDHITKDRELLREIEDVLRYETHPRVQAGYRRDVEQLQKSIQRYQKEHDDLVIQVQEPNMPVMQVLEYQLQQMGQKLDVMLQSQAIIHQNLMRNQQQLLSRYATTEKILLETVIQQLDQHQLLLTQIFVDAIEAHHITESEVEQMWAILAERLPELPASQTRVAEIAKNPELDARHKLKVTFPVIPFLVDYEGELELGSGFDLKTAWESLKAKLHKPSIGQSSPSHKPIWQIAKEIRVGLTEKDLQHLPKDGAAQHDYYIYGTPKIEQ